ncbi:membrane lipoprotein lipid attachment site-containing protein [Candidatus Kaiserbacteria bacterium]|nr:MAG: membrane lipoprotein lipid attachment site-containing protein [Candidatus Kaiserbacteria bacterium]
MKRVLLVLVSALMVSGCVVTARHAPQYQSHDSYYRERVVVTPPPTVYHIERRVVIVPAPDQRYHRDNGYRDRQYGRHYNRQHNEGRCMNTPYWHKHHKKYCH